MYNNICTHYIIRKRSRITSHIILYHVDYKKCNIQLTKKILKLKKKSIHTNFS